MFKNAVRAFAALTVAIALLATPGMAQAQPQETRAAIPVVVATPRLVDVRFATHPRFDRLVFDFRGGTPDFDARYVRANQLRDDRGRRVFLPGNAFLLLSLDPARVRNLDRDTQFINLRNVRAFRLLRVRGGEVVVAVALRRRADFRTFDLPGNRIVLDVENRRLLPF